MVTLLAACKKVQIIVEEMVKSIETDIRAQSNCKNSIPLEPVLHRKRNLNRQAWDLCDKSSQVFSF